MVRKNAISVKVKSPSRGLVTRLPSNENDLMNPATMTTTGDQNRVCTVAENVRFEDGVMANAPGYEVVALSGGATTRPAGTNLLAHWRMDEASGVRFDAAGTFNLTPNDSGLMVLNSVPGKIGNAANFTDIGQNLSNASNAVTGLDLSASDFTIALWFNTSNLAASPWGIIEKIVPATVNWEYVITQTGNTITFTSVAPGNIVNQAVSTAAQFTAHSWNFLVVRFTVASGIVSIQINGNSPATTTIAGMIGTGITSYGAPLNFTGNGGIAIDSVSIWKRKLSDAEVGGLYNSGAGLDYPFFGGPFNLVFQGNITGATPTPLFLGNPAQLFLGTRTFASGIYQLSAAQVYNAGTPGSGYRWLATDFIDKEIFAQNNTPPQYWKSGFSVTAPVPGLPTGATFDGVESFFGHLLFWSGNTLTWSDQNDFSNYIPVGLTSNASPVVVTAGFAQPAVGVPTSVAIAGITINGAAPAITDFAIGGFFRIDDASGTNFYQIGAVDLTHISFTLLDKTGRSPLATATGAFAAPTTFIPLLANEAGTAPIIGSDANGPIFTVKAMGDYAYVCKERSIQSMQYVGAGSGVFYIRTEVTNEGMISRYAMVPLGVGQIIFLGQRELYSYTGGATPTPICQQFTRQLFKELDRNNLASLVMLHRELRNEIWIVYPVIGGGLKVLVWNYFENSATLDVYDPAVLGITAARMVDWTNDPAWSTLSDVDSWNSYADGIAWQNLSGQGSEREAVLATGDGNLVIHGNVFNRGGEGYPCTAETKDFDFEDATVFKYVDVVNLGLQILVPDSTPRILTIQIGYRPTLDADLTWTTPTALQVQGNANFTAKVNPGGAGRFIRMRIQSSDADVQWRISTFEIFARPGGTY